MIFKMPVFCKDHIKLIRPYQWIKNFLVFAPLFFSGNLISSRVWQAGAGFIIFCMISALGYILNDWTDRKKDMLHPRKKYRPLCTGSVSGKSALLLSWILILACLTIIAGSKLPLRFMTYAGLYIILTMSYSLYFKSIVLLEVFIVAMGFVIRVLAGGAACGVTISSWLFLTVFFIAMMISIAKRLTELKTLGKAAAIKHRQSQAGYSADFLNSLLWSCSSIALVVYSLYALEHGKLVIFSVIPAAYGIFRFIYLTDNGKGSDPIKALFSDRQLLLTTLIFLLFLTIVIYHP